MSDRPKLLEGTDTPRASGKPYNGYTNWDTWEAYNLLSSCEEIYEMALKDTGELSLRSLLCSEMAHLELYIGHVDVLRVNYEELAASLLGLEVDGKSPKVFYDNVDKRK